jgi:hypothetical protein
MSCLSCTGDKDIYFPVRFLQSIAVMQKTKNLAAA